MGDRRMAEIKTGEGSLYIYVHWHGTELPELSKKAIAVAKPRWSDISYATKILVDQMIKPERDETTGFGILLSPNAEDDYNQNKPSIVIDLPGRELTVKGTKRRVHYSFHDIVENLQ